MDGEENVLSNCTHSSSDSGAPVLESPALVDPPDGFGTQLPFKQLPDYQKNILRREWANLSEADREKARENLEAWERSGKPPNFSGQLKIGEGPDDHDEITRPFKKGAVYGDAKNKI